MMRREQGRAAFQARRAELGLPIGLLGCLLGSLLFAACSPGEGDTENAGAKEAPGATPAITGQSVARGVSAGRMTFKTLTHDFGRIPDTEEVSCSFSFENTGSGTLEILDVKTSCGCTSAKGEELKGKSFAPGEGEDVEVTYKPKGRNHVSQTVTFITNSKAAPAVRLTITAFVEPFLRFEPISLQLNELEYGKEHRERVELTSKDPDVEILEVSTYKPDVLSAKLIEGPSNGGGDGAKAVIEVIIADSAPAGRLSTYVNVRARGRTAPGAEEIEHNGRLAVNASIFGEIHSDISFFAVGVVPPQGKIRQAARLTRPKGGSFQVTSARLTGSTVPGLDVRVEPQPDGAVEVVLFGDVHGFLGTVRGKVMVTTDVAGDPPLNFDVMGIVRELTDKDRRSNPNVLRVSPSGPPANFKGLPGKKPK